MEDGVESKMSTPQTSSLTASLSSQALTSPSPHSSQTPTSTSSPSHDSLSNYYGAKFWQNVNQILDQEDHFKDLESKFYPPKLVAGEGSTFGQSSGKKFADSCCNENAETVQSKFRPTTLNPNLKQHISVASKFRPILVDEFFDRSVNSSDVSKFNHPDFDSGAYTDPSDDHGSLKMFKAVMANRDADEVKNNKTFPCLKPGYFLLWPLDCLLEACTLLALAEMRVHEHW